MPRGASDTPTPSRRFIGGACSHVVAEDAGVGEEILDHVNAVEDLDKPGPVVLERAARVTPQASPVLGQFSVGGGGPQLVDDVEPRQRPDPVQPVRVAERLEVRGLQVGPRLYRLAE